MMHAADTAADLGRRYQTEDVLEVRRALLSAREFWFPIALQLHRLMVAVSRSLSIMMVWVYRIKGVEKSNARMTFGLILILPRCQARRVFWMGPGFRFMVGAFLVQTLLPGVKTCYVNVLLSWLLCIGHLP